MAAKIHPSIAILAILTIFALILSSCGRGEQFLPTNPAAPGSSLEKAAAELSPAGPFHAAASPLDSLPAPFAEESTRLGPVFTGAMIGGPQPGPDGRPEIVFENLVLVTDPAVPQKAFARPIVEMLGFKPHPPVERGDERLMVFYPVAGERGYNVPLFLDAFLQRYGGVEFAGMPIGEVFSLADGHFRQCFKNLCLDFDPRAPEGEDLQPAPLGISYQERFHPPERAAQAAAVGLTLQVWESQPYVTSSESMEIHAAVYEDGVALANREPVLTLKTPAGDESTYHFSPTSAAGKTALTLPPIEAPNGTLIAYQVCLFPISGESRCVGENYLIWTTP